MSLVADLKQRKLVQWTVAYAAAAFALLQAVDIVAHQFGWPIWVERVLIIICCVGFFITLLLAWYHGERGQQKVSSPELLILAVLLGIGGLLLWNFAPNTPSKAVAVALAKPAPATAVAAVSNSKSIAVLPFENLSSDKDNAYFAEGIQDEILTRLAKIGALKVISRTSTQRYASAPDNLPEIARQLGVANILEGSVQKVGDSVRINVQLIQARTDTHLWAEIYDRKLKDIFAIQSEVAAAIAHELQVTLTADEQRAVTLKPTSNTAAYDAYLRGLSSEQRAGGMGGSKVSYQHARDYFLEAVRLDPAFAESWRQLAQTQSWLYFNLSEHTPAALKAMQEAAAKVAQLRPGSGEAELAQGYYRYRGLRDFPGAQAAFAQAVVRLPNNPEALYALALIERRLGRMPQAIAHLQQAEQLDPRNPELPSLLGEILAGTRRFPEARAAYDRVLNLTPDNINALGSKIATYQAEGDLGTAQKLLATMPAPALDDVQALGAQLGQFWSLGRYDLAEKRCTELVAKLEAVSNKADYYELACQLAIADAQRLQGNASAANASYRRMLDLVGKLRTTESDDVQLSFPLAAAHAGLGDKVLALREAERAVALNMTDKKDGPEYKVAQAQILARFGEADAAIAILTPLMETPYGPTPALLRLDPAWNPIRTDPRFRKLSGQGDKP